MPTLLLTHSLLPWKWNKIEGRCEGLWISLIAKAVCISKGRRRMHLPIGWQTFTHFLESICNNCQARQILQPQTFLFSPPFPELLLLSTSCGLGYPSGQFGSDIPNTSLQSLTCPQPTHWGGGGKRESSEIRALSALCSHKSKAEQHSTAENPALSQTEPVC